MLVRYALEARSAWFVFAFGRALLWRLSLLLAASAGHLWRHLRREASPGAHKREQATGATRPLAQCAADEQRERDGGRHACERDTRHVDDGAYLDMARRKDNRRDWAALRATAATNALSSRRWRLARLRVCLRLPLIALHASGSR